VKDDPAQSARVSNLIDRVLNPENLGFVSVVAIVETVWVLQSAYRLGRLEVSAAIKEILEIDVLKVEDAQDVYEAIFALEERDCDFADVLIGARARRMGCDRTVTFDKGALRLPGFAPVP
jgi:predicted nucleic-acid-binding protein